MTTTTTATTITNESGLMDVKSAAKFLGISPRMLHDCTSPKGSLKAVPLGRRVLYRPADLREFVEAAVR